jgi:uncharacterized protein DUF2017
LRRLTARIRRSRSGEFELRLPDRERALLRSLPAQLRELLRSDDPALERLFPPAYADDPARDAEYQELVHDDLVNERLGSVETLEATIDATQLTEDQVLAWLSAINDLRLILGTRLDITEDMDPSDVPSDDPRVPTFELYAYLTVLEEEAVSALSSAL